MEDQFSILGRGREYFSSPLRPDLFCGLPGLLTQWVLGDLFPGVKPPDRDNLPPSSVEVKNAWSYTPIPLNTFS